MQRVKTAEEAVDEVVEEVVVRVVERSQNESPGQQSCIATFLAFKILPKVRLVNCPVYENFSP